MKLVKSVVKAILIYVIVTLSFDLACAYAYYAMGLGNKLTFSDIFTQLVLKELTGDSLQTKWMQILYYIQGIFMLVCEAVFVGYTFAHNLNRIPRIILPPKLVIRHRSNGNILTLGILVGNKSHTVHDVSCVLGCTYLKHMEPLSFNGEFEKEQHIHHLYNYYRFSFELVEFPKQILQDFINKGEEGYVHDYISISIIGHTNLLGNSFMVSKKYRLSDLVMDEHIPYLTERKIDKNGKIKDKILWRDLHKIVEVDEHSRSNIISEIENIINEKS